MAWDGPLWPVRANRERLLTAGLARRVLKTLDDHPKQLDPADDHSIINPVAIEEVLSPSTEKYDRGGKFRNYQQIPSLMEYILVAQDEAVIERFVRQTDGAWGLIAFVGREVTLAFTTVPVQIPLTDVYAGVSFDAPAA